MANLMVELAEAAANNTRLAGELDQERAEAYYSWSWTTAFTVLGVLVWLSVGVGCVGSPLPTVSQAGPIRQVICNITSSFL